MMEITTANSTHLPVAAYVERLINGESDARLFLQNPGKELQRLGFRFNGCDQEVPSFSEILTTCSQGFRQSLTADLGVTVASAIGVVVGVGISNNAAERNLNWNTHEF